MNRGRRFENVFEDGQDYSYLLQLVRYIQQMHEDTCLRKRIDELSSTVTKSQGQT